MFRGNCNENFILELFIIFRYLWIRIFFFEVGESCVFFFSDYKVLVKGIFYFFKNYFVFFKIIKILNCLSE